MIFNVINIFVLVFNNSLSFIKRSFTQFDLKESTPTTHTHTHTHTQITKMVCFWDVWGHWFPI